MAEAKTQRPVEIVLPSGAIAIRKPLTGKHYFKFQGMAAKGAGAAEDAMKWIVLQAFEVNGQPLTIDKLEDEMSFEDAAMLSQEINRAFLPYLTDKTRSPSAN